MIKKKLFHFVIFAAMLVQVVPLAGQIADTIPGITADSIAIDTSRISKNSEKQPSKKKQVKDTTHYALVKKIFVIKDTITVQSWRYNSAVFEIEPVAYDSTLNNLHLYNPAYKDGKINSYLGQVGQAINSQHYFNQNPPTRFLFLHSFTPYIYQASQAEYYNVKKPFTLFGFDTGPKDEQDVTLIHTQNVTQNLNFFFRFNSYSGKGYYVNQETKNNTGAFGGSFIKGRFATHSVYTFGRVNALESGGIPDTYFITDSSLSANEIGSRLTGGQTYIKDRQFFFDQKIGFIKAKETDTANTGGYWFSLQYTFDRQYSRKYYKHTKDSVQNTRTGEWVKVYENNYSGLPTFDSSSYTDAHHAIRLNLEEVKNPYAPFGLYGELGYQKAQYYFFNIDTLFDNTDQHTIESGFIEAGLHRMRPGLFRFYGTYRQYLAGYHLGDFSLHGKVIQQFSRDSLSSYIVLGGLMQQQRPDYFIGHYKSNHYKWDQTFNSRPLNTRIDVELNMPRLNTSLGGHYSVLNNYIYLNEHALPEQTSKAFMVFDVWLNNHLKLWRINLISKLNYQYSGNVDALPLPDFSAYESLFYEQNVHFERTDGRAKLQFGADMFYWTKYKAAGYSPALAMFYNQNNVTTGNYPFVGAFLNLEIKRLRFFLRLNHITYDRLDNNYFIAPNYPTTKVAIYYGIRWTFYD